MFDRTLIESGKDPSPAGRKKSLPLAIGLHAATIAALVGATVWRAGEPPEPVQRIEIWDGPPPPRGTGGERAAPVHPARPQSSAAPPVVALPPTTASAEDTSPSDPERSGAKEGEQAGFATGVEDGTGRQPVVGTGPVTVDETPLRPGGDVVAPVPLSRVDPEYPESMRRGHVEGVVILEAIITASGDVADVRVLKSVNPILDRAATDAVRRWRYRAATLNGRAARVYLTVTVTFGLRS